VRRTEAEGEQRNQNIHKANGGSHIRPTSRSLLHLPPEGAPLSELGLASSGLAEHGGARGAEHHSGRVAEHGGDLEAAGALDVHEEGVGRLDETLELVLAGLVLGGRVQQVVRDRHGGASGKGGRETERERLGRRETH